MYAIWTKEDKPDLQELSPDFIENERRMVANLLLHEQSDTQFAQEMEERLLSMTNLWSASNKGFRVYIDRGEHVILQPKDGGAMKLDFEDWMLD